MPLQELLVEELKDLLDAEKQLVRALPKLAKTASDAELAGLFRDHLEQTKGHVGRLEQAFEILGARPKSKPCLGMKGLVEEGRDVAQEDLEGELLDSAILGAARKVEHYEMAGYENACSIARMLGNSQAEELLQQTLDEERTTDQKLADVSKRLLQQVMAEQGAAPEEESETGGRRALRGAEKQARPQPVRRASSSRRSQPAARSRAKFRTSASSAAGRSSGALSKITTDHEEIRRWAEERGGKPAAVKGTGGKGDIGMIRIDFPGYSGGESLQPISWDEWFQKFEDSNLALVYQERTATGQKSNFNKLVSREEVHPRKRAA
ncbi:MAG TPA: ferritin-like domain-containing protein [Bryobacterales bacterium]|nr:ferritin-like domain-containing protein [Bryobacterales bacterium]